MRKLFFLFFFVFSFVEDVVCNDEVPEPPTENIQKTVLTKVQEILMQLYIEEDQDEESLQKIFEEKIESFKELEEYKNYFLDELIGTFSVKELVAIAEILDLLVINLCNYTRDYIKVATDTTSKNFFENIKPKINQVHETISDIKTIIPSSYDISLEQIDTYITKIFTHLFEKSDLPEVVLAMSLIEAKTQLKNFSERVAALDLIEKILYSLVHENFTQYFDIIKKAINELSSENDKEICVPNFRYFLSSLSNQKNISDLFDKKTIDQLINWHKEHLLLERKNCKNIQRIENIDLQKEKQFVAYNTLEKMQPGTQIILVGTRGFSHEICEKFVKEDIFHIDENHFSRPYLFLVPFFDTQDNGEEYESNLLVLCLKYRIESLKLHENINIITAIIPQKGGLHDYVLQHSNLAVVVGNAPHYLVYAHGMPDITYVCLLSAQTPFQTSYEAYRTHKDNVFPHLSKELMEKHLANQNVNGTIEAYWDAFNIPLYLYGAIDFQDTSQSTYKIYKPHPILEDKKLFEISLEKMQEIKEDYHYQWFAALCNDPEENIDYHQYGLICIPSEGFVVCSQANGEIVVEEAVV